MSSEDCDKVPDETPQMKSPVITSIPETQDINHSVIFHSVGMSESPTLEPNGDNLFIGNLPSFLNSSEPTFCWVEFDGKTFSRALNGIYDEIVHWKRNLFKVPSGKAGTTFVRELSRMFRAYADGSDLEGIAMKAAMVIPALLLQKPTPGPKLKITFSCSLEPRLNLWLNGNAKELLDEAHTIQRRLTQTKPKQQDDSAQTFAKLMMEGKVRATLQIVTETNSGGTLQLDRVADPESSNPESL